jgi:hypothetical protein
MEMAARVSGTFHHRATMTSIVARWNLGEDSFLRANIPSCHDGFHRDTMKDLEAKAEQICF